MLNVGPLEFVVLAVVGLIILGPDRLPGLARDAARLIKTLRDLASGARTQLRDELGPELADLDLRSLNPRTAIQRLVLGDESPLTAAESAPSRPMAIQPTEPGQAAPFDADAT